MRDEGISRKKDINLFPLLPFPLSLTVKAKPLRHAEDIIFLNKFFVFHIFRVPLIEFTV